MKQIKCKGEYRRFEPSDIVEIKVSPNLLEDESVVFSVDVNFGDFGFMLGEYISETRANEVLVLVNEFIDDEAREEYTMPVK